MTVTNQHQYSVQVTAEVIRDLLICLLQYLERTHDRASTLWVLSDKLIQNHKLKSRGKGKVVGDAISLQRAKVDFPSNANYYKNPSKTNTTLS